MSFFNSFTNYFFPDSENSDRLYHSRIGKFQGWISIIVNSILFAVKFIIGMILGSVSVIADAIHTLSDVISSGVLIWGFYESEKPADFKHPYGHGRAEYIATLIIAVLLIVVGIEFIKSSINRIFNPEPINPAWWMIIVVFMTIILKEFTARFAEFLSTKIVSEALKADAWHHRTDAISSLLVIIAMISGLFGYHQIDGWAGLGVASFIIWTGISIAKNAVDDLIGKPPTAEEIEEIRRMILKRDGVLGVHDITVHSYGQDRFVNVHIEIDAAETPASAHDIAEDVEVKLKQIFNAEPTVHMDPVQPNNPKIQEIKSFLENKWLQNHKITDVHDLRLVETRRHKVILFGINVVPGMTKSRIISLSQEIKESIKRQFPGYEVNIKISPLHRY